MTNKRVILSAYSCDPSKGSEPGNGFNWAKYLANYGHEVYCITTSKGKKAIEEQANGIVNLEFGYVDLPFGLDKIYYWSLLGMYAHYLIWQWTAYRHAKKIHKQRPYDLVHHVTWGSLQQGSFMYKLPIPLIFGPAGGGQSAPENFKAYFGKHWKTELRREKISKLLQLINPACKRMVRKASVILAANHETGRLAQNLGAKRVFPVLDSALPKDFFTKKNDTRKDVDSQGLKLLWVGRFLPRKGILLVLDVMHRLKSHQDIKLTVVGDGTMKSLFENRIDELSLSNQVNWVGRVPFHEIQQYYSSHDVFLFTSLRDSGGVQIVEAMSFGLPVITLDCHGQSLMVNEDCGFKASTETPERAIDELSKYILRLKSDIVLRNKMANNAREFALKQTLEDKVEFVSNNYYNLN